MLKHLIILALMFTTGIVLAQDDAAIIKASRAASNEAIAKHDIDGIIAGMLPDFTITRGDGVTVTGRDAVTATWKTLFKNNPEVSYVRTPSEILIGDNGIMAWETGVWVAHNSYSKGGNYSAMWRKTDGAWKLQSELFVTLHKL